MLYPKYMQAEISPTRTKILQHGLDLISTAGLSGIPIGTLAERTGMSKSGLFAHFGSREEVQLGLLDYTAQFAGEHVVAPAMQAPEGLPRLQALISNWLGWTERAGLSGGCPIAAGMFEVDDLQTPIRERLLAMEKRWRGLLMDLTHQAISKGHLRKDLDVDQFVWELCGIYLSHHASLRFVRDPEANTRAQTAIQALFAQAGRSKSKEVI